MKAILLICLLLVSTLFIPSSVSARELADKPSPVTGGTKNPKRPAVPSCGPGASYKSCIPSKSPPKSSCNRYKRNCPPA
ncbi:hypothetical protein FH972_007962 [Carpinus fangiana]|uniref:Uncharacterized protein n=1 Tax=Carpinus fangiana TaxID=176857 RepID=A0A5N6QZH8_9ROSI|nr:hypothetical protein FH972_007962 [Carpinus fangiana]